MTYCLAWKRNESIFMLSDSTISRLNCNTSSTNMSSFGEPFGIYNERYVSEEEIKINKISDTIAVSYAGNVSLAKQAIENFAIAIKSNLDINEALKNLSITYNNYGEFELLIVDGTDKNIYYFDGTKYRIEEDIKDIGSGKDIPYFSDNIINFIKSKKDIECEEHLVNVIAYIQCLAFKNNIFEDGVGGLFYGIHCNTQISWCKDLLYYIHENDINKFDTVSVISRYDGVFSSSTYNSTIKYYLNSIDNENIIRKNKYIQKSIIKSLQAHLADYVIFYDKVKNQILVKRTDKWPYNTLFRIWTKKNEKDEKYAFTFSEFFIDLINMSNNENNSIPNLIKVNCQDLPFENREDVVYSCLNFEDIEQIEDIDCEYDYDFRALNLTVSYNISIINSIIKDMINYYNIILIDYEYFYNILCEKYELYKVGGICLEDLNLEKMITVFLSQIASQNFEEYGVYILKSKQYNEFIDGFSVVEWLKKYKNVTIIETEETNQEEKNEFYGLVFETIKNYYFNDKCFCIDKLILFCDDLFVDGILKYTPKFNIESNNPDIILIRDLNIITKMDGRFKYACSDYVIAFMFGLDINKMGFLEAGILNKDLQEM